MEVDDSREIDSWAHGAVQGSFQGLLCVQELVDVDARAGVGAADSGDHTGASFSGCIKCLLNGFWKSDGLESEVRAEAVSELFDCCDGICVGGVDEVGCAEVFGVRLFRGNGVNGDDFDGTDHARALNDVESDSAAAEDGDGRAGADLCGMGDGSQSGDDAATDERGVFVGDVAFDANDGRFRHAAEGAEGGDSGVVPDGGAAEGMESCFTVGHETGEAHGCAELAKGGAAELTVFTAAAGGAPDGPYSVAGLDAGYARANGFDDAGAFVSEDDGARHGQVAFHHVKVTVTDAGCFHSHEHLSGSGI